jgi:hypothetical protein
MSHSGLASKIVSVSAGTSYAMLDAGDILALDYTTSRRHMKKHISSIFPNAHHAVAIHPHDRSTFPGDFWAT